ncbi:chaperone protein ClpB1-like [Cornus florida]|uniref:chaperone protein ClpB1-like n=1 Tax=Cornus florida TaxID=4283 RepID=UPI0028A14170|nr:chaperone protein ClpB1-like [Cornus florida]
MEPWMIENLRKLEVEYKDKFETAYGVEIHSDALLLACNIAFKYYDVLLSNEGRRGGNLEVVLEKKEVEMVEKACMKLRLDLDTNAEEYALDFDKYSLCRTLVELEEIKREKDPAKKFWFPCVQKDYEDLMDKWDRFVRKWKPTVSSKERAEEIYMLKEAHKMLVSCLQEVEGGANGMDDPTPLFRVAQQHLGTLVTELMLMIDENFKQNLTLTPSLIAEVASPLTGIPASLLLNFSEPPLQGLEPRLAKGLMLIGQEHVPFVISNALSRRRVVSQSRPIGSFLFLNSLVPGWTEIAKALAEQLFDDKERLIAFDLSEYSRLTICLTPHWFPLQVLICLDEGLLTEAVKRRPFTVVLFDNVDRAHPSVTDVLIEIISHGRVSNGQGSTTDFTKTLIIMTSNIMDGKVDSWKCKYVQMVEEIPLTDSSPDTLQQDHECTYLDLLREARRHFRHELFEKLDDVILFKYFTFEHDIAAARLQLRDIASSMRTMTEKRLILYPSDAALCDISSKWHHVSFHSPYNIMASLIEGMKNGCKGAKKLEYDTTLTR